MMGYVATAVETACTAGPRSPPKNGVIKAPSALSGPGVFLPFRVHVC